MVRSKHPALIQNEISPARWIQQQLINFRDLPFDCLEYRSWTAGTSEPGTADLPPLLTSLFSVQHKTDIVHESLSQHRCPVWRL